MTRPGKADVLIVGGGLGGVSAALTAARLGARVVLVEELDWLGGQLTAQGVPLDEHPWVELGVGSKSYLALRDAIREHYFRFYPVTPAARAEHPFNPGMGNVGTLCCEPKVALRVIEAKSFSRQVAMPLGREVTIRVSVARPWPASVEPSVQSEPQAIKPGHWFQDHRRNARRQASLRAVTSDQTENSQ